MSVRRIRRSFDIDTDTRLSTMMFLYGCSQEYRYFDFPLIESIYFNAYVRKLFRYDNLREVYRHPLIYSNPAQPEKIQQLLQKCKDEILAYEQGSKLIPLLKQALERLKIVSPMDFGAVIELSDDEWRNGREKDNGFYEAFVVFRNTLVGKGSMDDYPDWFECRVSRMRLSKIIYYIQNNPKATLEEIQDCVKCKANFRDSKDIEYELSKLEKELSLFQKNVTSQENKLKNTVETTKRKYRHVSFAAALSIITVIFLLYMSSNWWFCLIAFPVCYYLCYSVGMLLKDKKNIAWKDCISLHERFCDTLKTYIKRHK